MEDSQGIATLFSSPQPWKTRRELRDKHPSSDEEGVYSPESTARRPSRKPKDHDEDHSTIFEQHRNMTGYRHEQPHTGYRGDSFYRQEGRRNDDDNDNDESYRRRKEDEESFKYNKRDDDEYSHQSTQNHQFSGHASAAHLAELNRFDGYGGEYESSKYEGMPQHQPEAYNRERPPVHRPTEYISEAGPYGAAYQASPYISVPPAHLKSKPQPIEVDGRPIDGRVVKLYCKASNQFHIGVRPRQGVIMMPENLDYEYQLWIMDETMSTRVSDSVGHPAFCLVNKATGKALAHSSQENQQVMLADYRPGVIDGSLLWSKSEDMGGEFYSIRNADKITSTLSVLDREHRSGRIDDGTPIIVYPWKKQVNQQWKILPVD